jgi:glycosyltransferase involved in cell wall biosynthesis
MSQDSDNSDNQEVFFVIGSLQVGGAEMHLSIISRELAKQHHSISVYNLTGCGVLGGAMSDAGVNVICPPIALQTGKSRILNPLFLSLSSLKLFLLFLFKRPGIIHFFLPQAYIIGASLARCAGLSRLIMSRRSLNYYQEKHSLLKRLERKLHRHMTAIIGNSKSVVSQLHQDENVPRNKLGLIYNGIALERFDADQDTRGKRKDLNIPSTTIVMIIVANLISYKGHSDLLQAVSKIQDKMPEDWMLLAVGRDDGIGSNLRQQADTLNLGKKVRFLGPREDVADLLRISDLGILCSHEEGFSNAILEGMAASLPMVVTDVGGNAEAVKNGTTGLVVAAHSPSELGTAILRLVKDAALRKRMGQAARNHVEQEFSLEACVEQYEKLYDAVGSNQKLHLEG